MMETGFISESIALRKAMKLPKGKDTMVLDEPVIAYWKGRKIHIKEGFRTDGASIPRFAWRIIGNPWEEYLGAAVVHDWFYASHAIPRDQADLCFLDLMEVLGIGWMRRHIMYRAVRIGSSYRHHDPKKVEAAKAYGTIEGAV